MTLSASCIWRLKMTTPSLKSVAIGSELDPTFRGSISRELNQSVFVSASDPLGLAFDADGNLFVAFSTAMEMS